MLTPFSIVTNATQRSELYYIVMFQPEVKFEFIRQHLPPFEGWLVYVDIDASELGKTGGLKIGPAAQLRRERMQQEGDVFVKAMEATGVQVGGSRRQWCMRHGLPEVAGDRDITAFHPPTRRCIIGEVEGSSSGQPEQKLYQAIGQLVLAAGEVELPDWQVNFVLVSYGQKMGRHLRRATVLPRLKIYAWEVTGESTMPDHWIFGPPPLLADGCAMSPGPEHLVTDKLKPDT